MSRRSKPRAARSRDDEYRDIKQRREKNFMEAAFKETMKCINAIQAPGVNKVEEITSHLYISNWDASLDIRLLRELGISAILCVETMGKPDDVRRAYKKKKIEHMQIPIEDTPKQKIVQFFDPAYDFIHKAISADKKVLVHCAAGISRSTTMIMYYLLKRYYLTNFKRNKIITKEIINMRHYFLPRIMHFIKQFRPCASPNPGFVDQLLWAEYYMKKQYTAFLEQEAHEYMVARRKAEMKKAGEESDSDIENDPELFPSEKGESIEDYIDKAFEAEAQETSTKKHRKKSKPVSDSESQESDEKPEKVKKSRKSKTPEKPTKPEKSKKPGKTKKLEHDEDKRDKLSDLLEIEHSEPESDPTDSKKKPVVESDSSSEDISDESE